MNDEKRSPRRAAPDAKVAVSRNGPYLVSGGVPLEKVLILSDEKGTSVGWEKGDVYGERKNYALCRCGRSGDHPYCDGTHSRRGFDGTETADRARYVERAEIIEGPALRLADRKDLCASAGHCQQRGGAWELTKASDEPEAGTAAVGIANSCPSGRLVIHDHRGEMLEMPLERAIGVIEHPRRGVSGPLWVQGCIPVISADGEQYEVRNRVTLCRCGASKNKPFCDGTHLRAGFSDGDPSLKEKR